MEEFTSMMTRLERENAVIAAESRIAVYVRSTPDAGYLLKRRSRNILHLPHGHAPMLRIGPSEQSHHVDRAATNPKYTVISRASKECS